MTYKPPSWQEAWMEGQSKQEERDKQIKDARDASPYKWNGEGMALPPGDPQIARAKWEGVNPGVPFPQDELEELRALKTDYEKLASTIGRISISKEQ